MVGMNTVESVRLCLHEKDSQFVGTSKSGRKRLPSEDRAGGICYAGYHREGWAGIGSSHLEIFR